MAKKKKEEVTEPQPTTTQEQPVSDNNTNLSASEYGIFAKLFDLYQKMLYSKDIIFSQQTNWHNTHPGYRVHGYKTVQMSQVMGIYGILTKDFIQKFDTIIEIGTYNAGLSLWLYDNKKLDTKFVTYDIDGSINLGIKYAPNMDCRVQSCFDDGAMRDIENMIKTGGKTLVLCDGGDKPKEFNTFSHFLKSGDHIMAHDYKRTDVDWNNITAFWQWPYETDTTWEDIRATVDECNLTEYERRAFEFGLWGSFVKR